MVVDADGDAASKSIRCLVFLPDDPGVDSEAGAVPESTRLLFLLCTGVVSDVDVANTDADAEVDCTRRLVVACDDDDDDDDADADAVSRPRTRAERSLGSSA